MNSVFSNFIAFLNSLFESNYLITLICAIISGIFSFHIAKYSSTKSHKIAIKQKQLEYVYLPLHRLFNDFPKKLTTELATEYCNSLDEILSEHYIYAFPTLHKLNNILLKKIDSNDSCGPILEEIKRQIDFDYELLKKTLGYPSENWFTLFIRMTFNQKVEWFISWVNTFVLFSFVFFAPLYIKFIEKFGIFTLLMLFLGYFFVLSLIKKYLSRFKH